MPNKQEYDFQFVNVGILTALQEEFAACKDILDPHKEGCERQRFATSGTLNCWICHVASKHGGYHTVAITRLSHMGNTAAAIAANILLQHCDRIESLIMCGIAGAVPNPSATDKHVRLGDIVVSNQRGIIQYDFGKQRDASNYPNSPFNGFEFRAAPKPSCPRLLAAVERMQTTETLLPRTAVREWERHIDEFYIRNNDTPHWKRPPSKKDKLIDTPTGKGSDVKHPRDRMRRKERPRVFSGAIGAANIVLADPNKRNALRDQWDIRAIEMESSGVADASWVASVGYLVIRGTCDYCNSSKNDDWHHHAAVLAASYTRSVLENLHQPHAPRNSSIAPFTPPFSPDVREMPSADFIAHQFSTNPLNKPIKSMDVFNQGVTATPKEDIQHNSILETTADEGKALISDRSFDLKKESISVNRHIQNLTLALESGNLRDAVKVSEELFLLLNELPRVGADVREGWIRLASFEATRLQSTKRKNEPVNLTLLQLYQTEAENVVD